MTRLTLLIPIINFFLLQPSVAKAQTFVEACLGDTKILNGVLTCRVEKADGVSTMQFILTRGEQMHLAGSGVFGNYSNSYSDFKIVHLPPRTTALGVMNESVQFQAREAFHRDLAVITIPCHQSNLVSMGKGLSKVNDIPDEVIAACWAK